MECHEQCKGAESARPVMLGHDGLEPTRSSVRRNFRPGLPPHIHPDRRTLDSARPVSHAP